MKPAVEEWEWCGCIKKMKGKTSGCTRLPCQDCGVLSSKRAADVKGQESNEALAGRHAREGVRGQTVGKMKHCKIWRWHSRR